MTDRDDSLRAQAVALRQAGRSRREICMELGVGHTRLDRWLQGVPPHPRTRRPRAKDELEQQARALRATGTTVTSIAAQLDVSKSSVSLWVRDVPGHHDLAARRPPATTRWSSLRKHAEIRRQEAKGAAAQEFGEVSDRDLFIAGICLYWSEGAKDKPHSPRRLERVSSINSDPQLIQLFLRWLALVGVPRDHLIFRIQIHESADVEAAQRYWADVVGTHADKMRRPTLKRHNPKTVRYNVGEHYRGCLTVNVRCSAKLYRRIEGWWSGLVNGAEGTPVLRPD